MLVWVDCTAAAHPLVLRPLIERFEARGDEVLVTAREYGQTLGILDRLGIPYTAVGSHGGASALGKGRALARRSRALARGGWARRPPPSSPRSSAFPRRRCRTTSSPAGSARSPSARRARC